MSTIRRATEKADVIVSSIFVIQCSFCNEDLERYPKTLEEDTRLYKQWLVIIYLHPMP